MIYSALDHCLKDIKLQIPIEILNEAFLRTSQDIRMSLDGIIKDQIIVDIVLRKTNLYSGKLKKIKLQPEWVIDSTTLRTVGVMGRYTYYQIPIAEREYRDIISAIGIIYPVGALSLHSSSFYCNTNTLFNKTAELFTNTFEADHRTAIVPYVLDNNIIRLEPPQSVHVDWILTCLLAYDSNFTNLPPNMIQDLSKLCLYATQIYVYNKLKIPIDNAYIHGGAELGAFKELIENYADAYEKFEEALLEFRGAATFDKEQAVAMVSMMNL